MPISLGSDPVILHGTRDKRPHAGCPHGL